MSPEPQTTPDEDLARQAQSGSLAAFEALVLRFEHRVYGFVLAVCRNPADAREITQDTFVQAFRSLRQYNPRRPFGPWLFVVARNKCIDRLRSPQVPTANTLPELPDFEDPATLLSRREEHETLWALARALLPQNQFQALWMRYVESMSVAEVAQVLGKTQTHVKVLLFRARRALARELQAASDKDPSRERTAARALASVPGAKLLLAGHKENV